MTQASAPGKVILFGEHAVVYNQPALAVPLSNLRTTVEVRVSASGQPGIEVRAYDLKRSFWLHETDAGDPLAHAIRRTLTEINVSDDQPLEIHIHSAIPIASGLGSSAATSIAIIRALAKHFGTALEVHRISELAYEIEKLHHGTPSGIDNTVIAFECPLYFRRDQPPQIFNLHHPMRLIIGHSTVSSQTKQVVDAVRQRWQENPQEYNELFEQIGSIVDRAHQALITGERDQIGKLMNANHALLQRMGVSTYQLDLLVEHALRSGALGAKLSGAGAGGIMIALVEENTEEAVFQALLEAGADPVLRVQVQP